MKLSAADIVSRRMAAQLLAAQLLQKSRGLSKEQVVAHLKGIQVQDYAGAKWSVGIRLPEANEERAYYLLQRAGLEGLLCLGPNRGGETTYRLLPDGAADRYGRFYNTTAELRR